MSINPDLHGIVYVAGETKLSAWQPTGLVRWARYDRKTWYELILEQEWVDTMSGKSEWRKVPTEDIT